MIPSTWKGEQGRKLSAEWVDSRFAEQAARCTGGAQEFTTTWKLGRTKYAQVVSVFPPGRAQR